MIVDLDTNLRVNLEEWECRAVLDAARELGTAAALDIFRSAELEVLLFFSRMANAGLLTADEGIARLH